MHVHEKPRESGSDQFLELFLELWGGGGIQPAARLDDRHAIVCLTVISTV